MKTPYVKAGKVGNLVYQRSRYGVICYPRFIPANPRTEKQVTVRSYLATVSSYWRLLSELERLMWALAGQQQRTRRRLGRSAPLTGFNYFMRVNLRRLNRGGTLVERPEETGKRLIAPGPGQTAAATPSETRTPAVSDPQRDGSAPAAHRRHYGILSAVPQWWRQVTRAFAWGMHPLSA